VTDEGSAASGVRTGSRLRDGDGVIGSVGHGGDDVAGYGLACSLGGRSSGSGGGDTRWSRATERSRAQGWPVVRTATGLFGVCSGYSTYGAPISCVDAFAKRISGGVRWHGSGGSSRRALVILVSGCDRVDAFCRYNGTRGAGSDSGVAVVDISAASSG
jgi:hypothetical protein